MNPIIVTAIGLLGVAGVLVLSTVRHVPAGSCAVVTRFGRVTRVLTPGLVGTLPLVDRLTRVTVGPHRDEPVVVTGLTRDGFSVRILVGVLWQVHDARASLRACPDSASATSEAVERRLHHLVGEQELVPLLRDRERLFTQIEAELAPVVAEWGVTILDITVLDIELRTAPELLRILR